MGKRIVVLWMLVLCFALYAEAAERIDYGKIKVPEVYIFPTPRQVEYGKLDIGITNPKSPRAVIVLPASAPEILKAAAEDLNATIRRISPKSKPLPVVEFGGDISIKKDATRILLGVVGKFKPLDHALKAENIVMNSSEPGKEGYRILVRRDGNLKTVVLAGCDEQGAFWACGSFNQLLRADSGGNVMAYSAKVRDWPGFTMRTGSGHPERRKDFEIPSTNMSIRMKFNYDFFNTIDKEYRYIHDYCRRRGRKSIAGIWLNSGHGRFANKAGIWPYSWSNAALRKHLLKGYESTMDNVNPPAVYFHDNTDAGWWKKYINKFWKNRTKEDKRAYPQAHPAQADADKFNAIYRTVKAKNPNTEVIITVPCYYDNPQNGKLESDKMFRDYLRTLGRLTPNDIIWMLETRSAASCAAYRHYLGGQSRIINWHYVDWNNHHSWGTPFLAPKSRAGYVRGHYAPASGPFWVLVRAGGAQYMWNPDLPGDYEYLTKVFVPQASKLFFGDAWREMADLLVNLNIPYKGVKSKSGIIIRKHKAKLKKAGPLLAEALKKCPQSRPYGRYCIQQLQKSIQRLDKKVNKQLETAVKESKKNSHNVFQLDGQWDFKLDKGNRGIQDKWFAPNFSRSGWRKIDVPMYWESSGLAGAHSYNGYAWYAKKIRLPKSWKNKPITLHIGAADDEAWVYVNGKFVGDHLKKNNPDDWWSGAFEFKVTDKLLWDTETIVIRVNDTFGDGGIWKSVYLRMEKPEKEPIIGPGAIEVPDNRKKK